MTDRVISRPGVIELLEEILDHGDPLQLDVRQAVHRAVLSGRALAGVLINDEEPAVKAAARALAASVDSHGHACEACHPI